MPRGTHLYAQDAQARIVATPYNVQPGVEGDVTIQEWRYCLRRSGGWQPLTSSIRYSDEAIIVERVVLAGTFAAFASNVGLKYGGGGVGVSVRNLRSGVTKAAPVGVVNGTCPPMPGSYCDLSAASLVLASNGIAAWQGVEQCETTGGLGPVQFVPCAWSVQVLDGGDGQEATLDATPFVPSNEALPDPFASVQIARCFAGCTPTSPTVVVWTRDGAWRSAAAP